MTEFFEAHRQHMITGFIHLFDRNPVGARQVVAEYQRHPECLFPKIGHAVKLALDARALGDVVEVVL